MDDFLSQILTERSTEKLIQQTKFSPLQPKARVLGPVSLAGDRSA